MRGNWSIICARARSLPRHEQPIIQIEDDCRIVVVAALKREVGARTILGRDGTHTQRANVVAALHLGTCE